MTIAYVDANALIDRFGEAQDRLAPLEQQPPGSVELVSSTMTRVEIGRYLRRIGNVAIEADTVAMLIGTTTVPLNDTVLTVAGSIGLQHLGALDAIHLATALIVRADVVVTRDRQLARAAEAVGIPVL